VRRAGRNIFDLRRGAAGLAFPEFGPLLDAVADEVQRVAHAGEIRNDGVLPEVDARVDHLKDGGRPGVRGVALVGRQEAERADKCDSDDTSRRHSHNTLVFHS
jgi:hypothetical protein